MNWMQPNVVQAATARLAASGLLAVGLSLPAMAGDRALIDHVGFSADFRYFAFEEFGIQDGSGFAYSNIFVVDLETDSWVIGTPVRVQAESEETSLVEIRAEAARLAADHVDEFGLTGRLASVITSASCGYYKSRPEIYHCTADALGVAATDMVHIGDSFRFDVLTPRRLGAGAIWLNLKGEPPPVAGEATLIVGSLAGLADTILAME